MLAGVKLIPRDQIYKAKDENSDSSVRERKKSGYKKEKHRRKKKSSEYSSSDDEEVEKIEKKSKKNKKWYSSDEYSSSYSIESESESNPKLDDDKRRHRKKGKRTKYDGSGDEGGKISQQRSRSSKNHYSSVSEVESGDDSSPRKDNHRRGSKKHDRTKSKERGSQRDVAGEDLLGYKDIARKDMGLEWMLKPKDDTDRKPTTNDHQQEEVQPEEIKKMNPKELNPYFKDDGSGYPEDADGTKAVNRVSSSSVGDGGASWRMKALKRAQEQAAREGRKLQEVVGERWGSLGQLAVSVASREAAPSRAHLHATNKRRRGLTEECQDAANNQNEWATEKSIGRDYLKDVSTRHSKMKAPKVHDSLSWGKRKSQHLSANDTGLVSSAISSLNKFENDGSFIQRFIGTENRTPSGSLASYENREGNVAEELQSVERNIPSEGSAVKQGLSANQLAAKALQLRMKGKHEEAEELLREATNIQMKQGVEDESIRPQNEGLTNRSMQKMSVKRNKDKEDDADMHLAQRIAQSRQYSISGRADEEYDFDDGPRRKTRKKAGGADQKSTETNSFARRILTQQERCQFCFENPSRPRHLVVSIANFTYLMLPSSQPVVPGHCCILPMQHESATRSIDNSVWDEIRNFKKCLIMMFAKQDKDVVFLETVMGLAQQRRHCLIECVPLPCEIAKEAPLYFKKAIDEAEDEWSQHNAKKLIDTSEKGLRGSIPKDFPYFHVEFGLHKGFVHVIDDEKQFKSSLGLNVIRGMLQLADEDMYRRRRQESMESQKQAVASFVRDWEPFDWTKQLD